MAVLEDLEILLPTEISWNAFASVWVSASRAQIFTTIDGPQPADLCRERLQ